MCYGGWTDDGTNISLQVFDVEPPFDVNSKNVVFFVNRLLDYNALPKKTDVSNKLFLQCVKCINTYTNDQKAKMSDISGKVGSKLFYNVDSLYYYLHENLNFINPLKLEKAVKLPNKLYDSEDVDVNPKFIGQGDSLNGLMIEFVKEFLRDSLVRNSGSVYVGLTVQPDGAFTNIEVIKSHDDFLSNLALAIIRKIGHCRPAYKNSMAVTSRFTFRIGMNLDKSDNFYSIKVNY